VIATGLTVEEGIRIILSAGTATPSRLPRQRPLSVARPAVSPTPNQLSQRE